MRQVGHADANDGAFFMPVEEFTDNYQYGLQYIKYGDYKTQRVSIANAEYGKKYEYSLTINGQDDLIIKCNTTPARMFPADCPSTQ